MDVKQAGASFDSLIASFNDRILELQELVIARNMYPPAAVTDLSAIDTAVRTLEYQIQAIKDRVQEEMEAIPKAKKLIELSTRQQKKLEHMIAYLPSDLHESVAASNHNTYRLLQQLPTQNPPTVSSHVEAEPSVLPKGKKGRGPAPCWHVTAEEFDSLSSYMRGRLTLEKVNAAVNDMTTYAEANAQLISAPKTKIGEDVWAKALELRDIATKEGVKGKHFFLETDMRGSTLKLDNTGKAILTVLRHLGRIHENRIGHHRVMTLSRPR
ncbi:spindle and kinetochore-associated protein 1 homolog [Aristolochia californica]|uniref:spindle and kinetochore-associated protein 1 homolog n=1 Tax=Aristolochia californica TaxID=171875 RepID=UPI0035D6A83E